MNANLKLKDQRYESMFVLLSALQLTISGLEKNSLNYRMKKIYFSIFLIINLSVSAQSGFNYYKGSSRVSSLNEKAYTYLKKAYFNCIWKWTREGADSAEYYLKLAIAENSNYSAAYAFLAHVYQFETYHFAGLR